MLIFFLGDTCLLEAEILDSFFYGTAVVFEEVLFLIVEDLL